MFSWPSRNNGSVSVHYVQPGLFVNPMKTFLSFLICILAASALAADGYLTVTNGTTIGGAAGGGGAGDVTQAGQNNFSGSNYFGSSTTFAAPPLGNGSGLTNLNVSTATGTLPGAAAHLLTNSIGCTFSGGGSALTPGAVVYSIVPYDCTIIGAYMVGVPSGSAVIEVEQCSQTAFDGGATHPVSGDKITASTPPTITGSTKNGNTGDTTLSSWNVNLTNKNIVAFSVTSCTTITNLTLSLRVTHSQ